MMDNKKEDGLLGQGYSGSTTVPDRSVIRCDGGVNTEGQRPDPKDHDCQVRVEKLGGITSTELTIPAGISVLVGRNATNRSSFLRALGAGLGGESSAVQLKSDADSGSVELTLGSHTYTREYERKGSAVQKHGTPYVDDSGLVDNFVALFADSPARNAVEHGGNLRDILMQPVDTSEIQSRIAELKRERSQLDETIQLAETRKKKLPQLEEKRTNLEGELSSVEDEITELESVVERVDTQRDTPNETERLRTELEKLRTKLSSAERRSDEIAQQLEFRRNERTDLLDERDELDEDLDNFEELAALKTKASDLATEIEHRTDQRQKLEQTVEDLQSVIQVNETFVDGDIEMIGLTDEQTVTDALDPGSQSVECWTCGTEVERAAISSRIETLREIVAQQRTEISEIDDRISELEDQQTTIENTLDEYNEKTRRLEELENRIAQHGDKIEQLETDHEEQQTEISRLEAEIETVETEITESDSSDADGSDEFITAHKELTKLERERGRLESQLEEVVSEIEAIEALDEDRTAAEERREEVASELEELRGRIDRLETELVETLNSIMEDLIERLAYENIERVWLERKTSEGTTESSFELHIVRETDDGSVYEDTAETLSESEREIIGVVVALSGYLVHDIDRLVPFLLLDSVEMIDGERLASLLDYIESETDISYLSVALLPKDAESVEATGILDEYTTIDFESVSD